MPDKTHVEVVLSNGQIALVDESDWARLSTFRWRPLKNGNTSYVRRKAWENGHRLDILMHREILAATPGQMIDHINRNGLDNRRSNLRLCTYAENGTNRKPQINNKSGFRGVFHKTTGNVPRPWCAQIKVRGQCIHIGYFATKEEAARAYDAAALRLHGDFAVLNFGAAQ